MVVLGIFPFILKEAILPPIEVSLRTELALEGGEDPRRGYFCLHVLFFMNFLNLLPPAPFLKMIFVFIFPFNRMCFKISHSSKQRFVSYEQ